MKGQKCNTPVVLPFSIILISCLHTNIVVVAPEGPIILLGIIVYSAHVYYCTWLRFLCFIDNQHVLLRIHVFIQKRNTKERVSKNTIILVTKSLFQFILAPSSYDADLGKIL